MFSLLGNLIDLSQCWVWTDVADTFHFLPIFLAVTESLSFSENPQLFYFVIVAVYLLGACADICELAPRSGRCDGYVPMWYYNKKQQRCGRFIYTGCGGNGNRFETEDDCMGRCGQVTTEEPIVSGLGIKCMGEKRLVLYCGWEVLCIMYIHIMYCSYCYCITFSACCSVEVLVLSTLLCYHEGNRDDFRCCSYMDDAGGQLAFRRGCHSWQFRRGFQSWQTAVIHGVFPTAVWLWLKSLAFCAWEPCSYACTTLYWY